MSFIMAEKPSFIVVSDMDGVVAESQQPVLNLFNAEFGTSYTHADWVTFTFLFEEAVRLSGKPLAEVSAWLFSLEVMALAEPIPGAQEIIAQFPDLKISFNLTTSRPFEQGPMTREWMGQHFPTVENVFVRGEAEKGMKGEVFKAHIAEILQANAYIDDDPAVIQRVLSLWEEGKLPHLRTLIIVDRPWNDSAEFPPFVKRVGNWRSQEYGWEEIILHLQKLQQEAS